MFEGWQEIVFGMQDLDPDHQSVEEKGSRRKVWSLKGSFDLLLLLSQSSWVLKRRKKRTMQKKEEENAIEWVLRMSDDQQRQEKDSKRKKRVEMVENRKKGTKQCAEVLSSLSEEQTKKSVAVVVSNPRHPL